MKLLVDSHVVLWWLEDPSQLAPALQVALRDPANEVFFSPASIWELALKVSKGKLRFPSDIVQVLENDGFEELPISSGHALRTSTLPLIHLDPFDRLLIAQALVEGLVLATRDGMIARYDVPVMDA